MSMIMQMSLYPSRNQESHTGIQYNSTGSCMLFFCISSTLLVFWHGCSCVKTSVQLSSQMKSSGI